MMKLDTNYFERLTRKAERYDMICTLLSAPAYAHDWSIDQRNALRYICCLPEEKQEEADNGYMD